MELDVLCDRSLCVVRGGEVNERQGSGERDEWVNFVGYGRDDAEGSSSSPAKSPEQ